MCYYRSLVSTLYDNSARTAPDGFLLDKKEIFCQC
jgi:hypothetical protein